jgi:hypothetical protein
VSIEDTGTVKAGKRSPSSKEHLGNQRTQGEGEGEEETHYSSQEVGTSQLMTTSISSSG